MYILAIDQGIANLGYAVINITHEEKTIIKSGFITTKPNQPLALRIEFIFNELKKELEGIEKIDLIAGETLSGWKLKNVQPINYILYYFALKYKCPALQMQPKYVKKKLTDSGNASKELIISTINNLYNVELKNNHEADAVSIATIAYLKREDKLIIKEVKQWNNL